MAVEHRFGTPAHDVLLAALTRHFEATVAPPGRFHVWVAAAHETIRRAPDPRAWMAAHARAALGTVDSDHATFHTALAYAWHVGPSIVTVVERHLLPG